MVNRKIIALILAMTMIGAVTFGCSDNKEADRQETKVKADSTETVEVITDTNIFDGKKETRSFTISGVLHEAEGSYIDEYEFVQEKTKSILHLKGKFEIVGTMDGELGTATEAKLEIADECVFNDNRSEGKREMNLEEFKTYINSKAFHKPYSMTVTVDNGFVWLVELSN